MHRVVVPSDNYARAHGRHCVAFFCHPDNDAQLPTLPLTCAPSPAPPVLPPHPHVTLPNRIMNAAHHLQKRFRETYAWLSRSSGKHASYEFPVASWHTAPKFQSLKLIEDWIIFHWQRTYKISYSDTWSAADYWYLISDHSEKTHPICSQF